MIFDGIVFFSSAIFVELKQINHEAESRLTAQIQIEKGFKVETMLMYECIFILPSAILYLISHSFPYV